MNISDTKIYIMHCQKLKDRKNNLERQIAEYGLFPEWITSFDGDFLSENDILRFYKCDNSEWAKKINWQGGYSNRYLKRSEISLAIKHIISYQNMIENNYKNALMLEDDVIFDSDFNNKFNNYFENLPENWDMIFIGNGCNLRINNPTDNVFFYKKDNPATKCTDSYIINIEAAKKIIETIIPFNLPIDFELNYQIMHHNLNVFWLEPPIVSQGSQNGIYRSEIQ